MKKLEWEKKGESCIMSFALMEKLRHERKFLGSVDLVNGY
jgi:hypothetical protein